VAEGRVAHCLAPDYVDGEIKWLCDKPVGHPGSHGVSIHGGLYEWPHVPWTVTLDVESAERFKHLRDGERVNIEFPDGRKMEANAHPLPVPEYASADEAMAATKPKGPETGQAEEPVGWRIMRAFLNGYDAGLKRGLEGPLDHNR
jgi:hypothetical protein